MTTAGLPVDSRKLEEMSFHDQRERDRQTLSEDEYLKKYSNKKWYSVTEASARHIDEWLAAHVPGKAVLDYCCGLGATSLKLAQLGGHVTGIDISPASIETARQRLSDAGLADRATFAVMDAEQTTFDNDSFDVIICFGVLHHLDVTKAFPELSRVLRPGGVVIAGEALGYNPLIALYRRLTPGLRTSWEKDHILSHRELRVARQSFGALRVRYFHLFAIAAVPFRNTPLLRPLLIVFNALDSVLLRVPGLRLMAWQMVFELRKPNK